MTRTLILMRHAKSSWDTAGLADHDRPLNARGIRAAKAMGDWMRANKWVPDQVLCSTAARTRETLAGLGLQVTPEFDKHLYHASATQMLRILSKAKGQTVLMIGHNPGIAEFAQEIVSEPPEHARFNDFPTGAALILRFDVDSWANAAWRNGEVLEFVLPKELQDAEPG